jgi:Mg2+ and Co2+ transporter CorA
MENILMSFTNRIEKRLQQLEERLINHVVEIDKKIDNLKHNTSELETVIYDKLLPAIKTLQTYSINMTKKTAERKELTKHFNDITTLLANREIANTVTSKSHSIYTAATQLSTSTTSIPINDCE